jgi:hypothetical protein
VPETVPAKVIEQEGAEWQLPSLNAHGGFTVQTSLLADTPENRSKILEILDGEVMRYQDVVNSVFNLADFIAYPIKMVAKDTGELIDAIRLILIDDQGNAVSTCSPYVIDSLHRIGWAQGKMPPWEPPIPVKLAQQSTREGNRVFKLTKIRNKAS